MPPIAIPEPLFFAGIGAVGVFLCFFGYRMFRVALSVVGALAGALYGLTAMQLHFGSEAIWPALVGLLTGGVLGGGLAVVLYFVGIFAGGGYLGLIIGGVLVENFPIPYPGLVVIGCTVLVGLLTLAMQKGVIVLVTSVAGAWHAIAGYFYFREGLELIPFAHPYQDRVWIDELNAEVLVIWGGVAVVGFVVQNWFTGKVPPKPARSSKTEADEK